VEVDFAAAAFPRSGSSSEDSSFSTSWSPTASFPSAEFNCALLGAAPVTLVMNCRIIGEPITCLDRGPKEYACVADAFSTVLGASCVAAVSAASPFTGLRSKYLQNNHIKAPDITNMQIAAVLDHLLHLCESGAQ
jgi:hypothetical protein